MNEEQGIRDQPTGRQFIPAFESIPYPSHPALKHLFQSPIWLWRLGLGALVGRLFLILTTRGRKSGLPRHTAIEYHTYKGRTYVMAAWPKSDWYQNILADPHVTIQTAQRTERVIARRLTSDEELSQTFEFAEQSPVMRKIWQALDFDLSLEEFLAQKERFHLITFDPTTDPTPPPLEADLKWVWWLVIGGGFLGWWLGRRSRR